ncbi:MFS general substrate transporter [Marasmius fiardii PR-910]|nr:MFS general substrate transporter [Marasmius fiardii PR-910]
MSFSPHGSDENRSPSEEVEKKGPAFVLTWTEVKLLAVTGAGFFVDAYDLFLINPVSTMLQYRLYDGNSLPPRLEGFIKASANIGMVIGQILFGYLADLLGRKAVYGKELMVIILATILCLTTPTGHISPDSCLIYLGMFRILLGVGVGGDHTLAATVISDRANLRKRGTMLAYNGTNQGWGSLFGSLVTIIVLACYKHVTDVEGKTSKVDGVWRIVVGVSLVPAFGTLYQRLTMSESRRFGVSRDLEQEKNLMVLKRVNERTEGLYGDGHSSNTSMDRNRTDEAEIVVVPHLEFHMNENPEVVVTRKEQAQFSEFCRYFSEWRHLKLLIATSMCWFLLNLAFYGINLNQNFVLEEIGFDGKTGTAWERLFNISTGGLIITALGLVPGYWATVFTIEILGRKWIQLQGFLTAALFLGILAAKFNSLSHTSFIACFTLLQFVFNFGANMTIAIIPAELFPTRFRGLAHGISGASGKTGAIISALAFNQLSKDVGTPVVLWIFFGLCILGAFFTLLLPEVKGRDPDLVLAEEIREYRRREGGH